MPSPRFPLWLAASGALLLAPGPAAAAAPDTVVVGATTDSYPYCFQAPNGRLAGFTIELFDAVAAQAGLKVVRVPGPSLEVNRRFEAGEFDCVQLYSVTPARQAFAEFTSPVIVNPLCAVIRRDSGIRRSEDLTGRRVLYVTQKFPGAEFLANHHIAAQWQQVPSAAAGLQWVSEGKGDAIFLGRYTERPLIAHLGLGNLTELDVPLTGYTVELGFAVHRGNAALLSRLNGGLMQVERSGQYAKLWGRWFGPYETRELSRDQVLAWGAILLGAGLVAAVWALLRQHALHAALEQRSRELSAQRTLLQALYDHIPTGMTVVELRAGEPAVISTNREAVRLYGADAAEHLREAVRRHQARPAIAHYEWVHPKSRRMYAVTLVPLTTPANAAPRLCVLAEDVTARKQADAEIAQSRKMRAVGELVGGIAHEFNNLLTPILLKVGEISVVHADHPDLVRDLDVIAGAARRGADLTRRLLTFGRKGETGSEAVRLGTVVDACYHLLRSTVDRRIVWQNNVPAHLPPLRCNATDLNQVLINLLLNARDTLMDKIGRPQPGDWQPLIRVGAEPLPAGALEARRPGPDGAALIGWQHLTVTDNGMGMPAEVSERIFEPFFTTKDVGHGTGLGLATVWHIVTDFGGRIAVESIPGEGTTFHVHLPVWDAGPIAGLVELAPAPAPDAAAMRVLLVEDDPLVAKAMAAMLRHQRHKVEQAADGLEAERAIRAGGERIDLIVMDVNLPGMNGLELARRARLSGYAGRILVTSGRVDDELRSALLSVGIDGLLSKPFTIEQLDAALRECVAARAPA